MFKMRNDAVLLIHLLVCGIYFLKGFAINVEQVLDSCRNSILCDPYGILPFSEVGRLESELHTWNSVLSSLYVPCRLCKQNLDDCNTSSKVSIFKEEQILGYDFTRMNSSVTIIGRCKNNTVIVFEPTLMPCSSLDLPLSSSSALQHSRADSVKELPLHSAVSGFISNLVLWYFNVFATTNTHSIATNFEYFQKAWYVKYSCFLSSVHIASLRNNTVDKSGVTEVVDDQSTTSVYNTTDNVFNSAFNLTQNVSSDKEKHHLLTRHSHHGLTNNILTIIACLLGSGAMSLLLCFRRVRHLICSICTVCRSADDFRSLLADPDA